VKTTATRASSIRLPKANHKYRLYTSEFCAPALFWFDADLAKVACEMVLIIRAGFGRNDAALVLRGAERRRSLPIDIHARRGLRQSPWSSVNFQRGDLLMLDEQFTEYDGTIRDTATFPAQAKLLSHALKADLEEQPDRDIFHELGEHVTLKEHSRVNASHVARGLLVREKAAAQIPEMTNESRKPSFQVPTRQRWVRGVTDRPQHCEITRQRPIDSAYLGFAGAVSRALCHVPLSKRRSSR
jgi:hypothetical protein